MFSLFQSAASTGLCLGSLDFARVPFGGKRMQKYNLFPNRQNIFLIFFENNTQDAVGVAIEE